MSSANRHAPRTGRGAASNPEGRFEPTRCQAEDDGWGILDEPLPPLETTVQPDAARRVITRNDSPDIPFDRSINPYRGCEHGCIYCFARPSHAYLNLSPGLDFETRLFFKQDAAALLEQELAAAGYRCQPITIGANTDPYQPIEREYKVTRGVLEVLARCRHPATLITKNAMIERDIDLLAGMAADRLVKVYVSITTLSNELKRCMEPRTSSPAARLRTVRKLSEAGIPVGVLVAPVIPVLTDHELESIIAAAAAAGACSASYVLLRLPHELKELFREWLHTHQPLSAEHVLARLREMRGGRENDPRFGSRMRGEGVYATLLHDRFAAALRRFGLDRRESPPLDTSLFQAPGARRSQLRLDF
jgi:DNA repair photolyase